MWQKFSICTQSTILIFKEVEYNSKNLFLSLVSKYNHFTMDTNAKIWKFKAWIFIESLCSSLQIFLSLSNIRTSSTFRFHSSTEFNIRTSSTFRLHSSTEFNIRTSYFAMYQSIRSVFLWSIVIHIRRNTPSSAFHYKVLIILISSNFQDQYTDCTHFKRSIVFINDKSY